MGRLKQHTPHSGGRLEAFDDGFLVGLAQQGNHAAFDLLVFRHRKRVYNLLRRMVRDALLAEDLTVETFAQAYGALRTFRGDCAFLTWVHAIACRICARERRRRRRGIVEVFVGDLERDLAHPGPDRLEAVLVVHAVSVGLGRLTAKQRLAIILSCIEGRSVQETAQAMGLPPGTVKSHLSRGMKRLRQHVDLLDRRAEAGRAGAGHGEPAFERG